MYTQDQLHILEQFDALVAKCGSQNKACELVGISAAVMTPLKKGTYNGSVTTQFDKLASYFKVKDAASAMPAARHTVAEYVPTSTSKQVYEVIRNCQLHGGLAVACGDAGIGKTKAAKQFVRDYPNDAIYIALNPCFKGMNSLLKLLCSKLNVMSDSTIDTMWLGLVQKLRDGQVLIFDEAQHLTIKTIEALRSISDYFAELGQTLGIVFVGNTETATIFGGKKRAEFAQIANRTRQRKVYSTAGITKGDMELLFPDLAGKDMELDFLLGIAHSSQAIRGAVNLYTNALDNEDTSYEGLVAMAKHMEIWG